jgi:hypothetical protein
LDGSIAKTTDDRLTTLDPKSQCISISRDGFTTGLLDKCYPDPNLANDSLRKSVDIAKPLRSFGSLL